MWEVLTRDWLEMDRGAPRFLNSTEFSFYGFLQLRTAKDHKKKPMFFMASDLLGIDRVVETEENDPWFNKFGRAADPKKAIYY